MKDLSEIRHALKNHLMGIKLFNDLIRRELPKNKKVSQYTDKVDQKIDEATKYINEEIR